jgi:virginiamycin B lyase
MTSISRRTALHSLAGLAAVATVPGSAQAAASDAVLAARARRAAPASMTSRRPRRRPSGSPRRPAAISAGSIRSGPHRADPLGRGSSPHGVIQGPDKAAWITDGGQDAIVRVGWPGASAQSFAARRARLCQPQHLRLRPRRRSGSPGRAASSAGRRCSGEVSLQRSAARGPYGICTARGRRSGGARWPARSSPHRSPQAASRQRRSRQPRGQGARRVVERQPRARLGQRVEQRHLRARPGAKTPGARTSCRAAPARYAVYVDERDKVWVSDFGANACCASTRQRAFERSRFRARPRGAPDPRPAAARLAAREAAPSTSR